jgi:hypothetical protein
MANLLELKSKDKLLDEIKGFFTNNMNKEEILKEIIEMQVQIATNIASIKSVHKNEINSLRRTKKGK